MTENEKKKKYGRIQLFEQFLRRKIGKNFSMQLANSEAVYTSVMKDFFGKFSSPTENYLSLHEKYFWNVEVYSFF